MDRFRRFFPFAGLLALLFLTSCTSGGTSVPSGGEMGSNVRISLERRTQGGPDLPIPPDVKMLTLKVRADEMATIVQSLPLTQNSMTLNIPDGARREFIVCGYSDPSGINPLYYGSTTTDVSGPTTVTIQFNENFSMSSSGCTDVQPPSQPAAVLTQARSTSQIDLSWQPSTDNAGVTGYRIIREGKYLNSVSTTFYTDAGLPLGASYSYQIAAYDAAGNLSVMSSAVSGNTLGAFAGTKLYGILGGDYGKDVAVDGSGNIYLTGYTQGNLDNQTNAGNMDIFLTMYDGSGSRLWTRLSGTAGSDMGAGVAVDGSGNIYITGDTRGNLDGQTNSGSSDAFLTKYDGSGNSLWTRLSGTTGEDFGKGVAVDGSGNIYVAGDTFGSLDGQTNAGIMDIFLMKYDSSGNKLWTRLSGTASYDSGAGVAVDGTGNVYVTGSTSGDLDGQTGVGMNRVFLMKYDSSGTKLWTRLSGSGSGGPSSSGAYSSGVIADGSGNAYVTGTTYGDLDGQTNAGQGDVFLMKYDSAGNKLWTRLRGTTAPDDGHGAALDVIGNIYVTGSTNGNLDGNSNAGSADIFLMRYDSSGNKQ